MKIKIFLVVFLVSFGFYQRAFGCNTTTRPYEWPLFGNQERSVLPKEDEEFFIFLLEAMHREQEFALDAWACPALKNGIANALGFRRFCELLRNAVKEGNGFALFELKVRKQIHPSEHDKIYERLAKERNPAFLLDVYSSPHERQYFEKNFGYLLFDVEGETIEEKLLNAAIAKKWNPARVEKAEWLIKQSEEASNHSRLAEAFDLLRYAASRGFSSNVMYRLHQLLQTYNQFALDLNEHMDYLSAAAELGNWNGLYTSAVFALRDNHFSQAQEHLDALLELIKDERDCFNLREAALFLKDFIFLLERNFTQNGPKYNFGLDIYYNKGSLITSSQRRAARLLREMFAEVDRLTEVLADESEDEEDEEHQDEWVEEEAPDRITELVAKKKDNQVLSASKTKEETTAQILDVPVCGKNKTNDEKATEDSTSTRTVIAGQKVAAPRKTSRKRDKVLARQAKRNEQRNKKPQSKPEPESSMKLDDNPFADVIRERLMPVHDIVATILDEHQFVNKRQTQRFLNALNNVQLENTVGSHNKVGITLAEGCDEQTMTIVKAHNGKRRDLTRKYKSMTGDLKRLLQNLGINSSKDLR